MSTNNVDEEIIVGVNQSASQKIIAADLKRILSQIKDLEIKINHANLDKSVVSKLQTQINSIKTTLNISNINVNQEQAAKTGQQIGGLITGKLSEVIKNVG